MTNLLKVLTIVLLAFTFACNDDQPTDGLPKIIATGNPTIDGLTPKIMAQPNEPKLYAQRAVAYYEMEGYDEAIADMTDAINLDSTNLEYHYLIADIYLDYLKSRQAITAMERAVAIDPTNITSLLKLAKFQMILTQNENSLKTIESVLKLNKNKAEAYMIMGLNFEEMGNQKMAMNSYQTAIENDPKMAAGHMKLGQLFAKANNDIAVRHFDNAIAAAPNDLMTYYAKAEYLHNNDKLDEALEVLKEVIIKDHQFVDAYFRTGVIYLEKDSIEQAYNQFNLVVQNDPASPKGFYYRGFAAELKGDLNGAKNDYGQALTLAPSYEKAQEALSRLESK